MRVFQLATRASDGVLVQISVEVPDDLVAVVDLDLLPDPQAPYNTVITRNESKEGVSSRSDLGKKGRG